MRMCDILSSIANNGVVAMPLLVAIELSIFGIPGISFRGKETKIRLTYCYIAEIP